MAPETNPALKEILSTIPCLAEIVQQNNAFSRRALPKSLISEQGSTVMVDGHAASIDCCFSLLRYGVSLTQMTGLCSAALG